MKDNEFDLIFIDADHTYNFVSKDIEIFRKKLKKGGILCGDDCEEYYKNLPSEFIEKNKNNDFTMPEQNMKESVVKGYHCGVIKALYENFGDNYKIEKNSSFWWKKL